ncbi:hypothetical protein BDV93DRAFT_552916 [Ceratobasidium sp. AG-I]|nr:hypothetical protein BDV93DRAFT_552916 [Ceratobasidium sp. AG-I]
MNVGQLKWQMAHIYPSEKNTYSLPTDDHFRAFFSRFGPIFHLHIETFPDPQKDHAYLLFRDAQAIQELRTYLRDKTQSGYWKESCRVQAPISSKATCPSALVARLKPILDKDESVDISRRTSKRKAALTSGHLDRISIPSSDDSYATKPEAQDGVQPTTRKRFHQNDHNSISNTTSLPLTVAETSQSGNDALEMEVEELKLERDRMVALLEEVQVQRDEAVAWLNREIETYHALKKELRKVKREEKSRDEEVARLSRAISDSLSSLASRST